MTDNRTPEEIADEIFGSQSQAEREERQSQAGTH